MLLSLLSIPLGIATSVGLISFAANPQVREVCRENAPEVTGVLKLDAFLCVIVPFFQDLLRDPVGYFVGLNGLAACLSLLFFMFIEGGRQGSRLFTKFPVATFLLGQLFGVGAVFPTLVVPSLLAAKTKEPSYRYVSKTRSLVAVTLLVPFTFMVLLMLSLHQRHVDSRLFVFLATVFQFSPLFFLPLALFRPASSKKPIPYIPSSSYFDTAKFGYGMLCGLSLAVWFSSLTEFAVGHNLLPLGASSLLDLEVWANELPAKLATIDFLGNRAALGLLVDIAGVWLGSGLVGLGEVGFGSFVKFFFLSFLLSPGFAIAHLFFEREMLFQNQAEATQKGKQPEGKKQEGKQQEGKQQEANKNSKKNK